MDSYNKRLDFAEIDMSDDGEQGSGSSEGMAIPKRKERDEEWFSLAEALPKEQLFVRQARASADRTGEQTPFVPFMSYWPTYEQMNEAQLNWYFYWRSEVREERYPYTDLSYIFVYLYELINGIGWESPAEGYDRMMKLWDAYGHRYPKLNGYMADWVCDFVFVHRLGKPLVDVISRSQMAMSGELFDLMLMKLLSEEPSSLTWELILSLSDYDMQRSRFFHEGGEAILKEFAPRVIALVDSFLQRTTGKKLVDTFYKGKEKVLQRYVFRSSIYDASLYGKTVTLHIAQLRKCPPLRYYITQILRCTENKLRELYPYKGRLRGVSLKSETETLIQRFLDKEFKPERQAGPVITIDPKRLAELQRDSEEVRSMLTVEEYDEMGQEEESEAASLSAIEDQPADDRAVVWDITGMDEEWALFAGQLTDAHLEALYALKDPDSSAALERIAEQYGTMPALLLDEINDMAMETIGDLVLDSERISDDYIDVFKTLKR